MANFMENVLDETMICGRVRNAGIVGAGGAGFPTHIKLSASADIVIANGAECEPVLETDRHLMLREPARVIAGLRYAMEAVGAGKGILALKGKHIDIIERMKGLIEREPAIELFLLDNFYPAGDEHVLVYEATGRVVPMGGIPLGAGVVVNNVHTLALVADAMEGNSFTHRYVTVTGAVKRAAVAKLPVGMRLREAIDKVGLGMLPGRMKVVVGGPMMGKVEEDLEKPVVKTTGGIIVLPEEHKVVQMKAAAVETSFRKGRSVCCQCNFCTGMCPRYLLGHKLEPHKMMRMLYGTKENIRTESIYSAALCSDCGLCSCFACTMGLAPNLVNSFLKSVLAGNKIKPDFKNIQMSPVHEFRKYRKVFTNRLIDRLDLARYDRHLPFAEEVVEPEKVILPLKQHTGAASVPVVKAGGSVTAGSLVAGIPGNSMGANLHSPIDGVVREVAENIVIERVI